ncbi:MAG TPA: DNA-formamidopyrimidine glycosylase family protein, partial [Flavobacterium sp.]|nr:DNA-formamidopyrimidine glycosylase family protein [Flavobacterium sp.]
MPELPEVETIVRELRAALVGARIDNVWVNTAIAKPVVSLKLKRAYAKPVDYFKKSLKGAKIKAINRRGKLIIIELSNGN